MTFIRGRSVPGQFLIVDETQNMTPHEVKTVISRAGVGTKVILTGDPYQIDHPYLDSQSNGLAYVVERFKGVSIFGHVTLKTSERSNLASARTWPAWRSTCSEFEPLVSQPTRSRNVSGPGTFPRTMNPRGQDRRPHGGTGWSRDSRRPCEARCHSSNTAALGEA
jgi:hypothetical protein